MLLDQYCGIVKSLSMPVFPNPAFSEAVSVAKLPCSNDQADSRRLPLALLRLMILLPDLVDILFKKPCVRARFIRLG
jgi:hypothetical protein